VRNHQQRRNKQERSVALKTGFFKIFFLFLAAYFLSLLSTMESLASNAVSDTENCLLCHRFPGMGRFDETGTKRVFYVNDKKFAASIHGKLKCKDCHVGLDKIPHTDVAKVDCATKCHIKEPSTNQEFSHANMIDKYNTSVHGRGTADDPKRFPEDLPTCKYCHNNRMYNPLDRLWGNSQALEHEILTRCRGCHTQPEWAHNFYSHFTHRMLRRRTQEEVVKLCTSCHEDQTKMARHGLESIETYKDTFHWIEVKYGVENAPDCLSCHVPLGYSTHDIRPRTDPVSPINPANRLRTCSNQGGLQVCHPRATSRFSGGRVHAYGTKVQLMNGKKLADAQYPIMFFVKERAEADISEIAFMGFHQWLDFLAAKRKHKKSA
jgi:hypothetical protein